MKERYHGDKHKQKNETQQKIMLLNDFKQKKNNFTDQTQFNIIIFILPKGQGIWEKPVVFLFIKLKTHLSQFKPLMR